MTVSLTLSAVAVLAATAVLVRRLVAPQPRPIVTPLVVLAVTTSTAALLGAARGAAGLSLTVAGLGLVAVSVALLGTSDHLR